MPSTGFLCGLRASDWNDVGFSAGFTLSPYKTLKGFTTLVVGRIRVDIECVRMQGS